MIDVSHNKIDARLADEVPLGRSKDIEIARQNGRFAVVAGVPDVPEAVRDFLDIISNQAPPNFVSGVLFYRSLPPAATTANETHRDRDNLARNFVTFVAQGDSIQHEFFADSDRYEEQPLVVDNGKVIGFDKDLHRRPTRPAGEGRKVFISASVYAEQVEDISTDAEPYVCHSGVLGN